MKFIPNNSTELLIQYCNNIDEWPNQWQIDKDDVAIGQAINQYFKLFLLEKIEQGRTNKTIRIIGDYLLALGGELIREINDESVRKLSTKDLILKYIDEYGGPYWRHADNELDHAKYDSVCKQLFSYITEKINCPLVL